MKFKWHTSLMVSVSILFSLMLTVHATENADVIKAREFMQAGMFSQAATLLEKRIYDTPTDPEAHFQLGICYLNLREFKAADKRFSSAIKLDPEYEPKVERELSRSGVKKNKQKEKDARLKRSVYDVRKMLDLD